MILYYGFIWPENGLNNAFVMCNKGLKCIFFYIMKNVKFVCVRAMIWTRCSDQWGCSSHLSLSLKILKKNFLRSKHTWEKPLKYIFLVWLEVNFINILCAAFKRANPKNAKKYLRLDLIFMLLGSSRVEAAHKMLVKLRHSDTML